MPLVTEYFMTYYKSEYVYKLIVNFAWWLMTTVIDNRLNQDAELIINTSYTLDTYDSYLGPHYKF